MARLLFSVLLIMATVSLTVSGSLTTRERMKLHPVFQQLLGSDNPQQPSPGIYRSAHDTLYDAIVRTSSPDAVRSIGVHVNSVVGGFVTVRVSPADLHRLADLDAVAYIDPGSVNYPLTDVSVPEIGASLLHGGVLQNTPYKGSGAIVLIYDSGIDWKHLDFRDRADTTKSRILYIWDQTLTPGAGESSPAGLTYGVEYTKAQIENEIGGTPANFVRERDFNGHGTHIAGTAAGNGGALNGKYTGVAPLADIIVVKGGDASFSESRMIDGLTYALDKATALGKPIVVNWSIGGQTGPHDGTRYYEAAADTFVSTPGKVVCIGAGNDADKQIHAGGTIAGGASMTFTFTVPSYTPNPGTGNDEFTFDLWFNGNPDVTATVTSPNGITVVRNAGETGTGPDTTDGTIGLFNYMSVLNLNQNVLCLVYDQGPDVPRHGTWTLTVRNNTSFPTAVDGWLSSRVVGTATVTLAGGNGDRTVSMPGTSRGAITVAAYETKWSWPTFSGVQYTYVEADRTNNICSFSGIGPTRDNRQKPDIAAPGQGIAAALSSAVDTDSLASRIQPGKLHYLSQGTSMAVPHVTGSVALLLGANPGLTASQIKTLLTSTVDHDTYATGLPNFTWGYGKLDVLRAMANLKNSSASAVRTILAYDQPGSNRVMGLAGASKFGVRFTPTTSGRLSGIQVNVTSNANGIAGTGSVVCEVYSNNGGLPGSKIGNTVNEPLPLLNRGTNNYIQMLDANVTVASGTDYHIVLSAPGAGDTLWIRSDDGSVPANRSSYFNGSTWSALSPQNTRIRSIVLSGTIANVAERTGGEPRSYELFQNYPNPFNPATRIRYSIPQKGRVALKVYDILGGEVATLINEEQAGGIYVTEWNGRNAFGVPVASGVYFYRLESGNFTSTQKMVLVK